MVEHKPLQDCRVLVTPSSFGRLDTGLKKSLEALVGEVIYNSTGRPLSACEVRSMIGQADGYIAGLDHIDASVIGAAGSLQVIARYGVGVDRVDIPAATGRGIVITNTPGANAVAVAELTLALILSLARSIPVADRATRQGDWPRLHGIGLRGKTVGLIGLGRVGREVARRLKGFDCLILVSDPAIDDPVAALHGVELVALDELLARSDFVSLHLPALETTLGLVDRQFLAAMKPGAYLINTARGELVDEQALYEALDGGRLGGAALDCHRQEPLPGDHSLFRFPNVIITPHTGSHTDEAVNQMGKMAIDACLTVLRGRRPEHVVNPEVYEIRSRLANA